MFRITFSNHANLNGSMIWECSKRKLFKRPTYVDEVSEERESKEPVELDVVIVKNVLTEGRLGSITSMLELIYSGILPVLFLVFILSTN